MIVMIVQSSSARPISGMNQVSLMKKSALLMSFLMLGACATEGGFDETGGVRVVRSACPAVAIPAHTGDVTLFSPANRRDVNAIDVVAVISDLQSSCTQSGDRIQAVANFEVVGRRNNAQGAREVVLPYFATVMRGGSQVLSKQIGQVALRFEDGQLLARTSARADASISLAEATLPADIEARINRKRSPGDADAAVDPLTEPDVRAAVARASFELLVGFQLTNDQLAYNATR